jgi:hypothetical protein
MDCGDDDNIAAPTTTKQHTNFAMGERFSVDDYGHKESVTFFSEQQKRMKENDGVMYLVDRAQTQQTTVLAQEHGEQHSKDEYGLQLSLEDYGYWHTYRSCLRYHPAIW